MHKRVFKCHKGRFYILSRLFVLLLITLMLRIPSWAQDVNFVDLGVAAVAIDGLTVTVNSMSITEKTGSYEYQINYTLTNNTTDQAIDEGTFKMYYANEGGGLPQYGFFGKLFPGDTINKTYTFEELKSKPFDVLESGDNFFNSEPNEDYLKWRVEVPNSEPNQPPIADAGPDQTVFESVNLDGSASSDPDGTIISWQWSLAHRTNTELDRTATASNPTLTNLAPK